MTPTIANWSVAHIVVWIYRKIHGKNGWLEKLHLLFESPPHTINGYMLLYGPNTQGKQIVTTLVKVITLLMGL